MGINDVNVNPLTFAISCVVHTNSMHVNDFASNKFPFEDLPAHTIVFALDFSLLSSCCCPLPFNANIKDKVKK